MPAKARNEGSNTAAWQHEHVTSPMTTTTDIGTAASARVLSARTRAAYASDWALFTDHCAVTDAPALPADPETVVDFLSGCPAAPATRRRRVAAIDHHHTAAGLRAAGGVGGGAGRARPTHRRTLPTHGRGSGCGGGGAARAALARLDRRACSAAATAACWCCPNWRGCRTSTSLS